MRIFLALAALLLAVPAIAAPAGSISVSPAIGVAPYPATITWNVTGATSCTASGGWSGAKAVTGTLSITVSAASTFTLDCVAADGKVTVRWTAPTQNTDGSPLTDLAGFNVYRGTSASNLARVKSVGSSVLTADDTNLASGTYIYAVTAVNAASLESAKSVTASATVQGSTATFTANAAVQSIPNPPGNVTVTNATAYEVRPNSYGVMVARRIGLIQIGSACAQETRVAAGVTYNRIDPKAVDFFNVPAVIPPVDVFARCKG